jgi:alkanesulfonate monooxygenase SsuD/methylene tetrahydromethanopterin reductase-like flavin-dependent oxidoreductase (luciferase family)
MCRAAGEVADGFHVHPMHSVSYLNDVVKPALNEGAKTRGMSVNDLELYAPVFVITGDNETETKAMEKNVRQQVAFYGSTPSYGALLVHHGYHDLGKKLNGLMREGKLDEMEQCIPDGLLEEVAIICPPNEVGKRLRERYDGVLDRVALYMAMSGGTGFNRWDELITAVHAA